MPFAFVSFVRGHTKCVANAARFYSPCVDWVRSFSLINYGVLGRGASFSLRLRPLLVVQPCWRTRCNNLAEIPGRIPRGENTFSWTCIKTKFLHFASLYFSSPKILVAFVLILPCAILLSVLSINLLVDDLQPCFELASSDSVTNVIEDANLFTFFMLHLHNWYEVLILFCKKWTSIQNCVILLFFHRF